MRIVAWTAGLVAAATLGAHAQGVASGSTGDATSPRGVGARLFIGGAYDATSDAAVEPAGEESPGPQSQAGGTVSYQRTSGRMSLALGGSAVGRYFGSGGRPLSAEHTADAALGAQLTRATRLQTTARASYAPLFLLLDREAQPAEGVVASAPQRALADVYGRRSLEYGAGMALDHTFGRRTSGAVRYDFGRQRTRGDEPLTAHGIALRVNRRMSVGVGAELSYGYATTGFSGSMRGSGVQVQEVGVAFSGVTIPFLRAFQIRSGVGGAAVTESSGTRYRLQPFIELQRPLSQRWTARVAYKRPVQFVAGFSHPLASDAFETVLDGALGRRVGLSAAFSLGRGRFGFEQDGNAFTSASTSAGVRFALTRACAVQTELFHFHHAFGDGVALPRSVGRRYDRAGARVALTWALPLANH